MDGHVWRIPTLLAVMACSMLLLFAAGVAASNARRRVRSVRVALATLSLLVLLSAVAIRMTATLIARELEISASHIDPGPIGYFAPAMFAAFAYAVARRTLQGAWTSRSALLFYLWLMVFTAANIVNRCTPGWCETIGFPFAWRSWSDAIFELDGAWMGCARACN
jgi:hypothetical protein